MRNQSTVILALLIGLSLLVLNLIVQRDWFVIVSAALGLLSATALRLRLFRKPDRSDATHWGDNGGQKVMRSMFRRNSGPKADEMKRHCSHTPKGLNIVYESRLGDGIEKLELPG